MFNITTYDFGYSWFIGYGAAIPLAIAAVIGAVAVARAWPRWIAIGSGIVAVWSIAALALVNVAWGINKPSRIPDSFLASGEGRVLDVGAGSGRAAVGVLLTRPLARVTGVDLYNGYYGIEDNTPDRFMRNASIAHAANRADARAGDARALPFPDASFDAVVSSYVIDHLNRSDRATALAEVARVLKPMGEFALMVVNVDWWTWLVNLPMAHHPRVNVERWRTELGAAGFAIEEEGTQPITRYWVARKGGT
jgi:SAM-dependent methyltransferase